MTFQNTWFTPFDYTSWWKDRYLGLPNYQYNTRLKKDGSLALTFSVCFSNILVLYGFVMKLKGSHTSHVCSQELFPILPAPEPLLSSDFLVPQPSGPSTRAALAGWDFDGSGGQRVEDGTTDVQENTDAWKNHGWAEVFRHAIVKKPDFYPGSLFDFTWILVTTCRKMLEP